MLVRSQSVSATMWSMSDGEFVSLHLQWNLMFEYINM